MVFHWSPDENFDPKLLAMNAIKNLLPFARSDFLNLANFFDFATVDGFLISPTTSLTSPALPLHFTSSTHHR